MKPQTLETVYIYIYIAGLLSEKHLIQNVLANLVTGFVCVPKINIIYLRQTIRN